MEREITKKYTNGEVTVVWKPHVCKHSGICWSELLSVFNLAKKPWIDMNGASTDEIIVQVNRCPSHALTCYLNSNKQNLPEENEPVI